MSNCKALFLNVSVPVEATVPNGERMGRKGGKGVIRVGVRVRLLYRVRVRVRVNFGVRV